MSGVADEKVAKRYASALFAAAKRIGREEAVRTDLATLSDAWASTPALRQAMESPLIPAERKTALIEQIFGAGIDQMTLSFLRLLVEKGREDILGAVREEFLRQSDEARGLLRATATVAAPLPDDQRAALVDGLRKRTGKEIELSVDVDPSILGGVVVRLQDTIIDGSVRGSLERLREKMLLER